MRATIRGGLSAATAIVALLLGACAPGPKALVESSSASTTAQMLAADVCRRALASALKQMTSGELAEGYPALIDAIQSPAFEQLKSAERHAALLVGGLAAVELDKVAEAHPLFVRSSAMPEADGDDWLGRLQTAYDLDKREDAIQSLTQLGRHWPEKLQELHFRVVSEIVRNAHQVPAGEPMLYAVLDSLYVAKWTLPDSIEPSGMWRDLAALELDRQHFARAQEIMSRVQSPHVVVSMRIDRRFDRLREAVPQYFDVDAAVANELAMMRAIVQRSPRSLDAVVQLTYSMLSAGLYDDVLATTAAVMGKIKGVSAKVAPYDDMEKQIWILDNRARALAATQRWSEAEAEVRAAADRTEDGHPNVSNIINLAWFYAEAGRGDAALAALRNLGQDVSPFGLMQMHAARHAAALQKGDVGIANESFAYLDKHRNDAPETWQWTLVCANRLDEAAALLIERLGNPVLRSEALDDLQDYTNPQPASQRAVWNARWAEIKNRPDVRRAIDAVGRIESFRIPQEIS
jgi:tetratricopeptide (TPR) repeat protein